MCEIFCTCRKVWSSVQGGWSGGQGISGSAPAGSGRTLIASQSPLERALKAWDVNDPGEFRRPLPVEVFHGISSRPGHLEFAVGWFPRTGLYIAGSFHVNHNFIGTT